MTSPLNFIQYRTPAGIPMNRVLVTVGTGFGASSQGTTETQRAVMINDRRMIGFAAHDARLVDIDLKASTAAEPVFLAREGADQGRRLSLEEIEERWGEGLRSEMGLRHMSPDKVAQHVKTDIAAPLAFNLEAGSEAGGLRERYGIRYQDFENSPLRANQEQFRDSVEDGGPSLQGQLFLGALGALAALPERLSTIVPWAFRFQVAVSAAFSGHDAREALREHKASKDLPTHLRDVHARREAAGLNTGGPALVNQFLSPAYPINETLKKLMRDPKYLDRMKAPGDQWGRYNVPNAPIVVSAACAGGLYALKTVFSDLQDNRLDFVLWGAADAILAGGALDLEGFYPGALALAEGIEKSGRQVSDAIAPFDADSKLLGTGLANGAYFTGVTNLEFALRHFLPITSIATGIGLSGETGGKEHSAGVGFGGSNANKEAYRMSYEQHGFTPADYEHKGAHGTGTGVNSVTGLDEALQVRDEIAEQLGIPVEALPIQTVGATKARVAHEMAVAAMRSAEEDTYYLMGEPTVGIPTFRQIHPKLAKKDTAQRFKFSTDPVPGNDDGGVEEDAQGFGGFAGALLRRSANRDARRRYPSPPEFQKEHERLLAAYEERESEIFADAREREARWRRTIGGVRMLAEYHRWPGMKDG